MNQNRIKELLKICCLFLFCIFKSCSFHLIHHSQIYIVQWLCPSRFATFVFFQSISFFQRASSVRRRFASGTWTVSLVLVSLAGNSGSCCPSNASCTSKPWRGKCCCKPESPIKSQIISFPIEISEGFPQQLSDSHCPVLRLCNSPNHVGIWTSHAGVTDLHFVRHAALHSPVDTNNVAFPWILALHLAEVYTSKKRVLIVISNCTGIHTNK